MGEGAFIAAAPDGEDEAGRATAFTIGDLAREFAVTLRTLRYYEDRGLLHPRRVGTSRLYSRRDRERLKLILLGRRVGFPLAEIGGMLDVYDLHGGEAGQLRQALARFEEQIARLEAQKDDIEQALAALRRTTDIVAGLLRSRDQRTAAG